eukprot:gene1196-1378_t
MLLKLLRDMKADSIALCFDPPSGTSFRKEIFPEYKAQRPPMDQALFTQFPLVKEVAESLGIHHLVIPRFEADDLIATYARQASYRGDRVTVVSDDKDLLQLVTESVSVFSPRTNSLVTLSEVSGRLGIPSHLVTTYQSLVGDTVDNIPGIKGLGPKNASAIVNEFGHINNILDNIDQLPTKFKEKIRGLQEQIRLSYQLVTLNDNVDVQVPLDSLRRVPVNRSNFVAFLEKYKFNSIRDSIDKFNLVFEGEENRVDLVPTSKRASRLVFGDDRTGEEDLTAEQVKQLAPPNVTVVNDLEHAEKIVQRLRSMVGYYHACDTEVVDLDLKKQSPIGHGRVICFSIYCGPTVDFGSGSRIWVDVLGEQGKEIMHIFKPYFEDKAIMKVWHNYSFDRHILGNHGICVEGFGGDTIHMARLWDAARNGRGGYSLEALSVELLSHQKTSMGALFGKPLVKRDGTEGKDIILPPLDVLQRSTPHLPAWIEYSSRDAEVTWMLRENLQQKLALMDWMSGKNMWDFYSINWRPYGHLLTEMERRGMKVDTEHLKNMEAIASRDIIEHEERFRNWATKHCDQVARMNIGSDAQIQHLLFAPCDNIKTKEHMEVEKDFECENTEGYIEPGKSRAKKNRSFTLKGMGLAVSARTDSGWPAVDSNALKALSGKISAKKYGTAYKHFKDMYPDDPEAGDRAGVEACEAIASLLEVGSIGTLLSSFIIPLQRLADSNSRVHTSVNVNTETGRLSSKRPNLQNQPAHEKDRYKIRQAFTCEPGNTLIVADYGQLELRLLAHTTNCASMITAFKAGGDFHSRTALGMYDYIKEAVNKGDVILEWEGEGEPPKPVLKDLYGSERRKAKALNFSIAYGKTPHGLAKDLGCSLQEAKETLDRWYSDRQEVLRWQTKTISTANRMKWTRTLMGRYRHLPDIDNPRLKSHNERASINTPLQGGAADIVMKAMLIIEEDKRLKELGYQMIMQIHDELILEGPEEHAKEAREIVMRLMSNPLTTPLLIDLVVDCSYAKTWYEAK